MALGPGAKEQIMSDITIKGKENKPNPLMQSPFLGERA